MICKDCDKQRHSEYYQTHHAEVLGHNHARYAANKDTILAKQKQYYTANKKRILERDAAHRNEHLEEKKARDRAYYQAHTEAVKANVKRWVKANPERDLALHHRHRARQREAPGAEYTTYQHIIDRWEMWGNRCWICGAPAEQTDHVKPLARGGAHWPCNLRPICKRCNSAKKATWPYPLRSILYNDSQAQGEGL